MALVIASSLIGDLAEQTRLPRELINRFSEMWSSKSPPFFMHVGDDGMLALEHLSELIRSLRVSSPSLLRSCCRVISHGEPAVSFATFVRGYASLHARTLKEALPFAFRVADLDGDGKLSQAEFREMVNENLAMQELDPAAINRVLATDSGKDAAGVSYDAFRYFASLSSETILATCGFFFHVRDFYVPPAPFGTEAEEEAEEARKREEQRRRRETEHSARERRAAEGGEGGEAEAARDPDGGEDNGEVNPFTDPDFVAALDSLKTTPEERAERCKDAGNEALRNGGKPGLELAAQKYGEGLDERCTDALLNATLRSNRAAAHVMLKNWGKAYADAVAALDAEVLAVPAQHKACRRAASAAYKLRKLEETEGMLERWRAVPCADEAQLAEVSKEMEKLALGVREVREAAAAKEREAEVGRRMAQELEAVLVARGLRVGEWDDPSLQQQCVGPHTGARVWYDAELDEVHWPVLLLYPEPAQSDFIQDMCEGEALLPHLAEMFGVDGEGAPDWDRERKYRPAALSVYLLYLHEADGREVARRIRADFPLGDQLKRAQDDGSGYQIRGIPMLQVVVRGSAYEKKFFTPKMLPGSPGQKGEWSCDRHRVI